MHAELSCANNQRRDGFATGIREKDARGDWRRRRLKGTRVVFAPFAWGEGGSVTKKWRRSGALSSLTPFSGALGFLLCRTAAMCDTEKMCRTEFLAKFPSPFIPSSLYTPLTFSPTRLFPKNLPLLSLTHTEERTLHTANDK